MSRFTVVAGWRRSGRGGVRVDYTGRTQLSFRIESPAELESEGGRIFAAHAAFMTRTHHRDGNRALLHYIVAKTPAEDGVVVFQLTEIHQSPAGVDDHVEQADNWDTHDEFVAWLDKCRVARTFDGSSGTPRGDQPRWCVPLAAGCTCLAQPSGADFGRGQRRCTTPVVPSGRTCSSVRRRGHSGCAETRAHAEVRMLRRGSGTACPRVLGGFRPADQGQA